MYDSVIGCIAMCIAPIHITLVLNVKVPLNVKMTSVICQTFPIYVKF